MNIKDRLTMHRLEKKVARDRKKNAEAVRDQGNASDKDVKGLYQNISKLNRTLTGMRNGLEKAKNLIPVRLSGDELVKEAKRIMIEYCEVFETLAVDVAERFWKLSAKYDLAPVDKFNPQYLRKQFTAMKSSAKKTLLTKRDIEKLCKMINKYTGHEGATIGFADPVTCYIQFFTKAPLLLGGLAKNIGAKDFVNKKEEYINWVKGAKKEAEEQFFKRFDIIEDYDKLKDDEQYRAMCVLKLNNLLDELEPLIRDFDSKIKSDKSYKVMGEFRAIAVKVLTN